MFLKNKTQLHEYSKKKLKFLKASIFGKNIVLVWKITLYKSNFDKCLNAPQKV